MTLKELAAMLGGELSGPGDTVVRGVAALETATGEEISFLANTKYEKHVAASTAAAVIVGRDYRGEGKSLIRCADSYFAFRQAMVAFYGFRKHHFSGIDPRSNVHASARIGQDVAIGSFATIDEGASIGDRTVIYPGVFVGAGCRIGADCILYPNVTIYDLCVLGDRVTIHAGTSVGQDGFGFATYKGKHEKIPQAGWVEIESDVEIGACCAIDRATMGATVIGAGTKFSNLIAIGHGTRVGRGCLMVAQSGIAGSTTVGNYCVFGGQSGAEGHIKIGDGVQVAAQSGVVGNIPPGIQIGGSPAMPLASARRCWMTFPHLPNMRSSLRTLIKEVAALKRRLGGDEATGPDEDRDS
ncbi:MAG: UDP-3-O-(3-hydroxymyristoyl)glucosamine N-acyltransferase [Phycisphaerae bacterium]|jgi:UDP-3-O-[3-hydroxymyristoyl] glucosamine N-acyltransferase